MPRRTARSFTVPTPWLGFDLRRASQDLRMSLLGRGASQLTRADRYALLADKAILRRLVESSGNDPAFDALVCRAESEYGAGADSLQADFVIGSLAVGGVTALIPRAGLLTTAVATANEARSLGTISQTAFGLLRASAFGLHSAASYSNVASSCSGASHAREVRGSDDVDCISAPSVRSMEQDSCVLSLALAAIGYAGLRRPSLASSDTELLSGRVQLRSSNWHTELIVDGQAYNNIGVIRAPTSGPVLSRADRMAGRVAFEANLRVTRTELSRLKAYLEVNRGRTVEFPLQTCTAGACRPITAATDISIPAPFNLTPGLNSIFLSAARAAGWRRIESVELVGRGSGAQRLRDYLVQTGVMESFVVADTAGLGFAFVLIVEGMDGQRYRAVAPIELSE